MSICIWRYLNTNPALSFVQFLCPPPPAENIQSSFQNGIDFAHGILGCWLQQRGSYNLYWHIHLLASSNFLETIYILTAELKFKLEMKLFHSYLIITVTPITVACKIIYISYILIKSWMFYWFLNISGICKIWMFNDN